MKRIHPPGLSGDQIRLFTSCVSVPITCRQTHRSPACTCRHWSTHRDWVPSALGDRSGGV